VESGLRILDLHTLLEDCGEAFERFVADLHTDAEVRRRVLLRSLGLLSPVRFETTAASASSGGHDADESGVDIGQRYGAIRPC
jgi:hypothetical protein